MAGTRRRAREVERARYERQQQRRARQRVQQRRRQRSVAVAFSIVAVLVVSGVIAVASNHKGSSTASSNPSDSSNPSTAVSDSTDASSSPSAIPTPTSLVGISAAKCAAPAAGTPGKEQLKTAPTLTFPADAKVSATLKTDCGDISFSLDAAKAPATVASLVTLARKGYFDHTKCHRLTVEGIFVLQCGDPTGTGSGGPGYTIPDENLPKADSAGDAIYPAGTLAMANTGSAHTGGSQFFLVYQDTTLGPSYSVFGTMTPDSLKVVREIAKGGVADDGADGAPALNVVINSVTVTGAPASTP